MEGNRHLGLLIVILFRSLQESVAIDAPVILELNSQGRNTDILIARWRPATGATAYEVTWLPPHGNLNGTSGDLEGTTTVYFITDLMPGWLYRGTITSKNGAGDTNEVSGIAGTFPAPVLNLAESGATNESISAKWNRPRGLVDRYHFACSNGTEDPSSPIAESGSNMASCVGLSTAGANYTFTVTSQARYAKSAESTITITALPNPVELTESDSTVDSVSATWMKPAGEVTSHEVQCSSGNVVPPAIQTGDGPFSTYCGDLPTPGDEYTMNVTSLSNGKSSDEATIALRALPEAVELSEGESNTTAISATWTVPNSVVDTFNITCSNGTASPASIPVISGQAGQQLMANCVGLPQSGELYDLSIVAISNDKLSAVSTVGVFTLPLGVDLEEGPSTLTSVRASWMRQNDPVESYSITCSNGDASPSTIEDTDQESFSAACVNLTGPGATYSMTVYNMGTKLSSNSTRASSLISLVAVPASVESIAVTEPTTTTVDVQWNLMQCSDCVYNYFLLTFEPDSQEPIRVDYTDGVNEYSSQVSGLTQGRSYSFTVVSVSGVGVQDATLKTSEEKSVDQRTVPATPFGLGILSSQRALNLVWLYQGDADDFTITVTPDHGIAVFNGNFTNPDAEIIGLAPGTTYAIAIVTVSGDERSEPITETARTEPDRAQISLIVVVVALLLYAVAITFLHIQLRRKVPTRTEENGPDPYMDLQPRPDADRTYQEMAITSTASSKRPGERRAPSSHLIYENQNVAQFANKIKEGDDYENVLTPN